MVTAYGAGAGQAKYVIDSAVPTPSRSRRLSTAQAFPADAYYDFPEDALLLQQQRRRQQQQLFPVLQAAFDAAPAAAQQAARVAPYFQSGTAQARKEVFERQAKMVSELAAMGLPAMADWKQGGRVGQGRHESVGGAGWAWCRVEVMRVQVGQDGHESAGGAGWA